MQYSAVSTSKMTLDWCDVFYMYFMVPLDETTCCTEIHTLHTLNSLIYSTHPQHLHIHN